MKGIFLTAFLSLAFWAAANAQYTKGPLPVRNNVPYVGTYLKREYYPISDEFYGFELTVKITTDMRTNQAYGELEVKHFNYGEKVIGTLDFDEIDACIKFIEYFSNVYAATKPETKTDLSFVTRNNLELAFQFKKGKWTARLINHDLRHNTSEISVPVDMRCLSCFSSSLAKGGLKIIELTEVEPI